MPGCCAGRGAMRKTIFLAFLLLYAGISFAQQDTTVATDTTLHSAVDSTLAEGEVEEAPPEDDNTTNFSLSPTVGFTWGKISNDGEESENLQWQMQLQSRFSYEGEP